MDHISLLNEYSQKSGSTLEYVSSKIGGVDHNPEWLVDLNVYGPSGIYRFQATAPNVKLAKQLAAQRAVEELAGGGGVPENHVGRLNTWAQLAGSSAQYREAPAGGQWRVTAAVGPHQAEATAPTKKDARQAAAARLLAQLPPSPTLTPAPGPTPGPAGLPAALPPEARRPQPHPPYHFPPQPQPQQQPPQTPAPPVAFPPAPQSPGAGAVAAAAAQPWLGRPPAEPVPDDITARCSCPAGLRTDLTLFIDADNVPRDACLHFTCRAYLFVGKLTAFPPKRSTICRNSILIRCNWHSSDAVDVLLAMYMAQIGPSIGHCVIISRDQIMQSVYSATGQLPKNFRAEWHETVPPVLISGQPFPSTWNALQWDRGEADEFHSAINSWA